MSASGPQVSLLSSLEYSAWKLKYFTVITVYVHTCHYALCICAHHAISRLWIHPQLVLCSILGLVRGLPAISKRPLGQTGSFIYNKSNPIVNTVWKEISAYCIDLMWTWKYPSRLVSGCSLVVRQQARRRCLADGVCRDQLSSLLRFVLHSFPHAEEMTHFPLHEPPVEPITFTWNMELLCSICLYSRICRRGGEMQQVECDVSQINDHTNHRVALNSLVRWAPSTHHSVGLLGP